MGITLGLEYSRAFAIGICRLGETQRIDAKQRSTRVYDSRRERSVRLEQVFDRRISADNERDNIFLSHCLPSVFIGGFVASERAVSSHGCHTHVSGGGLSEEVRHIGQSGGC